MKLVQLTDLHLVPPGRRLYGLDPNERLRRAIADINAEHADAAFVLITGDLVHDGERAAYETLKAALRELVPPCRLLLGNHDDRAAFRSVFPEAPVDDGGFVQQVLETPAGPFILLDTHEPGTHAGRLCRRRLAWLTGVLADRPGEGVFVAMHHPPLGLGLPAMDTICLREREDLAEVVARHGTIRHILFGHVHRPVHGTWNRIPFSAHRGLNHQVALTFKEAKGIPGSHEPPAYAVITVTGETAVVQVHDFLDSSPRFDLFDRNAEQARTPADFGPAIPVPLTTDRSPAAVS